MNPTRPSSRSFAGFSTCRSGVFAGTSTRVWTAFRILRALEDYHAVLVDAQGRIALARGAATRLATFMDDARTSYILAVQKQIPVHVAGREGICPDYRLEGERDETALLLVECKQRGFYWAHP
jgi:hypothetical protein